MLQHPTGTREEWLRERLALLAAEKEHTRRGDALARQRQALPWVRVAKEYRFDTETGPATLAELFGGRSQLLVYHFMFGPDYTAGCPSCSAIADGIDAACVHLAHHDVTLMAISRAPLAKLLAYRSRMGWRFPWASSGGSDFNADYSVSFTAEEIESGDVEYNFRQSPAMPSRRDGPAPSQGFAAQCGVDRATFIRERPGVSAFVRDGNDVFHTYSAYARGVDGVWAMYAWLDRAPLGRNENGVWWKRHDEYPATM